MPTDAATQCLSCGATYRAGFDTCADCGVDLVPYESEAEAALRIGPEDGMVLVGTFPMAEAKEVAEALQEHGVAHHLCPLNPEPGTSSLWEVWVRAGDQAATEAALEQEIAAAAHRGDPGEQGSEAADWIARSDDLVVVGHADPESDLLPLLIETFAEAGLPHRLEPPDASPLPTDLWSLWVRPGDFDAAERLWEACEARTEPAPFPMPVPEEPGSDPDGLQEPAVTPLQDPEPSERDVFAITPLDTPDPLSFSEPPEPSPLATPAPMPQPPAPPSPEPSARRPDPAQADGPQQSTGLRDRARAMRTRARLQIGIAVALFAAGVWALLTQDLQPAILAGALVAILGAVWFGMRWSTLNEEASRLARRAGLD